MSSVPASPGTDPASPDPASRRLVILEIVAVLAVTFGLSGVNAAVSLIQSSFGGLSSTTVSLNPTYATNPVFDIAYNIIAITKLLAWAGLGIYLVHRTGHRCGLGRVRSGDAAYGAGLAALIGLPGLALYVASRALHLSADVLPAASAHWWQVPLLIAKAIGNAGAEEVIVVAFFLTRLENLGVAAPKAIFASAVLRGSYHLYQGAAGGIGNIVMGLIFGYWWQRTRRLWPLVIAHSLIDIVAFVGYALAKDHLAWIP